MIGAGVLWLLSLAGVTIRWELVVAIAIIAVGLLLVASPGRPDGDGLIGLGVVLGVVALLLTVLPGQLSVSAGERSHDLRDAAAVESPYLLGAGTMTIDLRELDVDRDIEIVADVSVGELIVRLPEDVRMTGRARTGLGEVSVLGEVRNGISPVVDLDETGPTDGPTLDLDLGVGLGSLEVTR